MIIREATIRYKAIKKIEPIIGDSPENTFKALKEFYLAKELDVDKEHFFVVILDSKNRIKGINIVSIGTLHSALVHPREVLKPAILASARAIIIAHNHPSGYCEPSRQDENITKGIKEACEIMGIDLLDHIIFNPDSIGFFSFADMGLI